MRMLLSQADLAKKLGLSQASLCDLESGRRIPSPRRAAALARKLGLPEPTFIGLALEHVLCQQDLRGYGVFIQVPSPSAEVGLEVIHAN